MENPSTEYFGSEAQQGLQWRADKVWILLKEDPQFSCHGRAVALAEYQKNNLSTQLALARLQGVCPIEGIDRASAKIRKTELEAEGLVTDEYVSWTGGPDAFDAAGVVLQERALPDDLTMMEIDTSTPLEDLKKVDALTQICDVLLPMGSFLRGLQKPSVFLFAKDNEGRVVGASAAVAQYHSDHDKSKKVWWGMLATDESRRGEGIALLLGAMALRKINAKFGYTECFTGIREGNKPSEALCSKLALAASSNVDLIAIYPPAFSGGQLTK
jgi:hypothetical protein